MSNQLQLRRGTAAETAAFTGAPGEVTVVTDDNSLRVHDGVTPGGHAVAGGEGGGVPEAPINGVAYTRENGEWVPLPTIPAAQVNSDWNATSGSAQILNKPTIPTVPTLATVATTGNYSDLSGKPTIPAAQVNADWNASSGSAQILNKPTIPSAYTLPVATGSVLGGVKAGSGVSIAVDGTLSATGGGGGSSSPATSTVAGIVKAGIADSGITVANDGSLTLGQPNATLRNVATRCRHDQQLYTGATLVACAGRSVHVNFGDNGRGGIYGPQIVLGNWVGSNNGESSPAGGAITEYVSIEYPAGEYTIASWDTANGSATRTESISIPAGGADVVSDPVPIFIPTGATFWVRRYSTWTSGTAANFPVSMSAISGGPAASGDTQFVGWTGAVTGNDLRSYLTGTAISGSTTAMAQMRYPLAIAAMSNVPSAAIYGDSRVSGFNDGSSTVTIAGNPGANGSADWGRWGMGEVARGMGHARPYTNLGCPTDQVHLYLASNTFRTRQQAWHTDVVVQYGVNDLNAAARTSAAVLADLQSMYALFPTKRIWAVTVSPVSTSTDSFATNANQTPAVCNANRIAVNTQLRTVPAPLFGVFDNATVAEGTMNSGIWNVVTALGQPTTDGIHPNPAYYKQYDTAKSVDPTRLTF